MTERVRLIAGSVPLTKALPPQLVVVTLGLAGVFVLLGAFFLIAPASGSVFFGYPTRQPDALFFVRAIGLRDLAVGLYMIALTLAGRHQPLFRMLAATTIIPIGDLVLLAIAGTAQPINYILHSGSLFCFAGLALWVRGSPARAGDPLL